MPNYRRTLVPGGCWFFTVNLLDRRSSILTQRINALREAVQWTLQRYPFRTDAFVVLPDHIDGVGDSLDDGVTSHSGECECLVRVPTEYLESAHMVGSQAGKPRPGSRAII